MDSIGDARVDIGKGLAVAEATCGVDVVGVAVDQLQAGELGVGVEEDLHGSGTSVVPAPESGVGSGIGDVCS